MASVCKSNRVNDTPLPVRPNFTNLYKWPESDVEFVKTVNSNNNSESPHVHSRGVDSLSCRQTYLKSYTFSRKKVGAIEKIIKYCLSRTKEFVFCTSSKLDLKGNNKKILGRAKDVTCAVVSIYHRLLSYFDKFDVAQRFLVISIL
ncbi:uncharacterized protein LOC130749310 [Lotus japonicus]|uniref:uncharacterized protein LOC130749310 n=1 Tax=Lotus japonicus TaxID=34305 RepID=UPI002588587B|nr:uncharacterized protein LOC130749310 [Lotus japonicus]